MSGFIALMNDNHRPVEEQLLKQLTQYLQDRGPDGQATWRDDHIGFGHALFRTTSEAIYENQPASLDGKVWLICSARIDGRQDLLNHLGLSHTCRLETTADSELILRAYHKWGEHCLQHLIGDYAFVIWDRGLQKLFCARDRFGMRQLYYARPKNSLILGNSLQCMLSHPDISKELNDQAIGDFLLFGDHTWPDKTQTAFAEVSCLPPAHSLIVENGSTTIRRYWEVPVENAPLNFRRQEDYIEHFQEVFDRAVTDRLRSSNIVISLSGGLDSPSIASVAKAFQKRADIFRKINAVSIIFSGLHPCREQVFIEKVVQHLSLPVTYIDAAQYRLLHPLKMETTRPCDAYTPLLFTDFSRLTGQLGNVMLTGTAGDNLLKYVPLVQDKADVNWLKVIPEICKMRYRYGLWPSLGTGILSNYRRINTRKRIKEKENYPLYLNKTFANNSGLYQRFKEFSAVPQPGYNSRYSTIKSALQDVDWNTDDFYTTMGFVRPEECDPFLDLRLVRTVLSLPQLPWLFNKHILRQAMRHKLPQEILERRKTPLGELHISLLKKSGKNAVLQLPIEERISHYVDIKTLHQCWREGAAESAPSGNLRPFLLQAWLNNIARW